MKRGFLLHKLPLSGCDRAVTGTSTSGNKRTTALGGRISHLFLMASVLIIALLSSAGMKAEGTYTVVMADQETSYITAPAEAIAIATKTFTLTAADGYKLPATLTKVAVGDQELSAADGTEANKYTYVQETGVVTISAGTTISDQNVVTVTAEGVELSHDATLSALTYKNTNISSGAAVAVTGFDQEPIPTITLEYDSDLEGSNITLTATVTATGLATAETEAVTITDGKATATVVVTAEDKKTTKTYTVNFEVALDKLSAITVPSITITDRVRTAEDVLAVLNEEETSKAFAITTVGEQAGLTLPVTWSFNGNFVATPSAKNTFTWTISEEALAAKRLDQNEKPLTGEVSIANPALSSDAKLSALSYAVDGGTAVAVTGFNSSDVANPQTYTVTLSAETPIDAILSIEATTNNMGAKIEDKELTVQLVENAATISFTVTAEDNTNRKVTINFTRTASAVATLEALTYQAEGMSSAASVPSFAAGSTSYAVALPYNTPATGSVVVMPTTTSPYATYAITEEPEIVSLTAKEAEPLTISLVEGEATLKFTVTAEDGEATQAVTITFTTAKEKITAIEAPVAPELTEALDQAGVLAEVEKIKNVSATRENGELMELPITWALKGGPFTAVGGAKNTYTWTATSENYAAFDLAEEVKATGDMIVVNYVAVLKPEADAEVTIDNTALYNKVGDGEEVVSMKSVTVDVNLDALSFDKAEVTGDVTINSTKIVGALSFNETTVAGKIDLLESVDAVTFSNATIGEVSLAASKSTTLSLAAGNQIDKITNAGTLTLNNVAELRSAVETKAEATVENKGAVKAVENNSVFTDNTATIVTVSGGADLTITSLPQSKSTTGSSVELAVATETPTAGTIAYQWQKFVNNAWVNANGEGNDATTLKVLKSGDGQGTFRCEVKNTNSSVVTTLYTPSVSVAFRDASTGGGTPATPTYTVKLPKVTGATFSKTESTVVSEGDDFSFSIKLDAGYSESKPVVKVGNATYEPDANGNYVINAIARDITISVTGITKNIPTGLEEVLANTKVYGQNGMINIVPATPVQVMIVNMTGSIVVSRTITQAESFAVVKGIYIVRLSNKEGVVTHKVSVR